MQRKEPLPEQMRCTYNTNVSAQPADAVETMYIYHMYIPILSMADCKHGHKTYMQLVNAMPCA